MKNWKIALITFLFALPLAAQTTGILIEHQARGPVLAAPALYACVPPGTNPGPCVFVPVKMIEGAALGPDLVLRVSPQFPDVATLRAEVVALRADLARVLVLPETLYAQRQPDGTWIATHARLRPGVSVFLRRNGLENYAPADYAITLSTGQAIIKTVQPWDASSTVALWVWP